MRGGTTRPNSPLCNDRPTGQVRYSFSLSDFFSNHKHEILDKHSLHSDRQIPVTSVRIQEELSMPFRAKNEGNRLSLMLPVNYLVILDAVFLAIIPATEQPVSGIMRDDFLVDSHGRRYQLPRAINPTSISRMILNALTSLPPI